MYKANYLNETSEHKTFEEAFEWLYVKMKEGLEKNEISYQSLETMIWIKEPDNIGATYFYDARDKAYMLGLLKNGKLQEKVGSAVPMFSFSVK